MRTLLSMLLRRINYLLGFIDLKLNRLSHPTRSFNDFFAHLKRLHWDFKTVIDVGVAYGTESIYQSFPRARYYLVEPLEECRSMLERLKARLDAQYFLVVAGAEDGTTVFNVHTDLSGSSMFEQSEGAILDGTPREVPVRRLDSILPSSFARPVLLKLDTQGAELDALQGLGNLIHEVDVMIVETSLMKFRKGTPEFADVVRNLAEYGFVVYDILEGHVRALDGALAQVDLVFVPLDSPLRSTQCFFDDAQARSYVARWA